MAGLMEMLFGPDGVGGQPGLAGKAGNAIWQGTGELSPNAGFGETIAKSLGNIPHMLTDIAIKNPLEILKDPSSALNDNGEVSITRLLFPDFRRNAVKQRKDQEKLESAMTSARIFNTYDELKNRFMEAPTDQLGGLAQMADASGIPSEQIESALAAANVQRQKDEAARTAILSEYPDLPPSLLEDASPEDALRVWLASNRDKAISTRQTLRDVATDKRREDAAEEARRREARTEKRMLDREERQRLKEQANAAAAAARKAVEDKYELPIEGRKFSKESRTPAIPPAPMQADLDAQVAAAEASQNDWIPFNTKKKPEGIKSREQLIKEREVEAQKAADEAYDRVFGKPKSLNDVRDKKKFDGSLVDIKTQYPGLPEPVAKVLAAFMSENEDAFNEMAKPKPDEDPQTRSARLRTVADALETRMTGADMIPVLTGLGYTLDEVQSLINPE